MKRLLVFLLTIAMLISVSGTVFGKGYPFKASKNIDQFELVYIQGYKGFDNIHSWYSIQPEQPGFKLDYVYFNSDYSNYSVADFKYTKNDQTYVQFNHLDFYDDENVFSAGYLFDFGLFLSASYYDDDDETYASVGYRWNSGENNYLAIKYIYDTEENNGFAYVANGKFYTDQYFIKGTLIKMVSEWDDEFCYQFALNYQLVDNLVVGLCYANIFDERLYEFGCTWGNEDSRVIVDAAVGNISDEYDYQTLSAMVKIVDGLRIGAELEFGTYDEYYNQNEKCIKLAYKKGIFEFGFKYFIDYEGFMK